MSTGAASVLAWTGTASVMVGAMALLGGGLLAQEQAGTAADLAALAGADALAAANAHPCAVAAEVAQRNDARLTSCERRGWDVLVTVEVRAGSLPLPPASARARAGPGPEELP
ncbi:MULTISPECIES: Rv3654c family TadE-like protein [unclassified Brachybacterium]|uniref:Rv3654c family TadE-like protein n=1 Tax=unclassified Brachybacterium TaxID=2623841 RepID=UPI000C80322F|nr:MULTISPECIES: Rv3654c family TadE-like protein [unclassified Brachybacterium]PMC76851.1 hypothetical protein CJ197_00575 [Brachybacterium sp. UMB0905]